MYPDAQYLPTASVILVFYDEGWGVLLRTVHSVINTSPAALLKEIVLIDDGSTDSTFILPAFLSERRSPRFDGEMFKSAVVSGALQEPLETYIKRWNGLVKLYRTGKRVGLIEARTLGAQKSVGDVIIVLDAHCECVR